MTTITNAPQVLEEAAETFRQKNAQYGSNSAMVGQILEILYPNGIKPGNAIDWEIFHLVVLKVVKLTRFAVAGHAHEDSIHDDTVYSAMVESLMRTENLDVSTMEEGHVTVPTLRERVY